MKVILIYGDEEREQAPASAVEFKLNIPFKTVRKTLYVDITGKTKRSEAKTTKVFASTGSQSKFVDVQNDEIFYSDSPVGKALGAYYTMWRTKERCLARVYSKFIGESVHMHFTYGDSVSYY